METVAQTDLAAPKSQRPSMRLIAGEAVALIGTSSALALDPAQRTARRGDGHAVLVLPALLGGDPYTTFARQFLASLGYSAHGWNLGLNIGPTKRLLDGTLNRLIELSDRYGPLSVVGFSMGGLFARWLSLRTPHRIRQVITVCSPVREPLRNFWLPLESFLGLWPDNDISGLAEEIAQALPVPGTFLFSRDDGCVNYPACWDANAAAEDNIEITGPHVLIARNPMVMNIVTERLARVFAAQHRPPGVTAWKKRSEPRRCASRRACGS